MLNKNKLLLTARKNVLLLQHYYRVGHMPTRTFNKHTDYEEEKQSWQYYCRVADQLS